MSDQLCECGSGKTYMQCCGEYHRGLAEVPNTEALLRSRYCAYVRNDDDYLNRTWHPSTRPSTPMAENPALKWRGLEIIEKQGGEAGDSQGTIEFVARFTEGGVLQQLHERSRFVCEAGRWLYMDGDDLPPINEVSGKVGRNDPCPCGSGKKFKKCCGS